MSKRADTNDPPDETPDPSTPEASAGSGVNGLQSSADTSTPEATGGGFKATPETPAKESVSDTELANDYKAAASGLQRVYVRLCSSLGLVDPVCVKVNEAIQLAEEGAESELEAYQPERPRNGRRGSVLRIPESELVALLDRMRV